VVPDTGIETVPQERIQTLDKPSSVAERHGENLQENPDRSIRLVPGKKAVSVPLGQFRNAREE